MDSDNKFWATVWIAGFVLVGVIAVSLCLYNYSANKQIVAMVEKGADPMRAACGIGYSSYCPVLAGQSK